MNIEELQKKAQKTLSQIKKNELIFIYVLQQMEAYGLENAVSVSNIVQKILTINHSQNDLLTNISPHIFISKNGYANLKEAIEKASKNTENIQCIAKNEKYEWYLPKDFQDVQIKMSKSVPHPNQILFGPPGTGKTYHTINKALEIVNPDFDTSQERHIIKAEFDRLLQAGQVAFCTFHQSTGYEDFLESIKPETHNGQVVYEVQDGIFKRICVEATYQIYKTHKKNTTTNTEKTASTIDFDTLWLSFLRALDSKHIFKTKTNLKIEWLRANEASNLIIKHQGGLIEYTISKKRMETIYKNYKTTEDIKNVQDIKSTIGGANYSAYWAVFNDLKVFEKTLTAQLSEHEPEESTEEADLAYQDKKRLIADFALQEVSEQTLAEAPRYVLIIDEINRGNVAQIFGELITLIEDSKRAGKAEALEVILPYSRERFAVPQNLYLMGTMNSADRSVEALDTALRRRFIFQEMPPLPALLKGRTIEGIDLEKLLTTINQRLEVLLDKDHAIGHSYFLPLKDLQDLKNAFKQQILPLLQEYFFGEAGKVNLVLGDAFVKKQEHKTQPFAKNNSYNKYLLKDLQDREIYHFTESDSWQASDFITIYSYS